MAGRSDALNDRLYGLFEAAMELMRVREPSHAIWLLINSGRVYEDLSVALRHPDRWDQCVVLRRWWEGVTIDLEFRMFCVDHEPVAITQYNQLVYSPLLHRHAGPLGRAVRSFYEGEVKPRLQAGRFLSKFVCDFAIHPAALDRFDRAGGHGELAPKKGEIMLIELNPFYESTGMGLFDYRTDAARLVPPNFEFRVVEAPATAEPPMERAWSEVLRGEKHLNVVRLTDGVWDALRSKCAAAPPQPPPPSTAAAAPPPPSLTRDADTATVLPSLPERLEEPYVFLSAKQADVCKRLPLLAWAAPLLPGWIPHRCVASALGHGIDGISKALGHLDGKPYVWATEFENVHSTWHFDEPDILVDGVVHPGSEAYYQSRKPVPFDDGWWLSVRVDVMRCAVRAKFAASSELRRLLLSTTPHPLLSIKEDAFWGFSPRRGGENMLASLLEELRAELAAAPLSLRDDILALPPVMPRRVAAAAAPRPAGHPSALPPSALAKGEEPARLPFGHRLPKVAGSSASDLHTFTAADEVVYRVSGAGDDGCNGDYVDLRLEKEGRTYRLQKGAMDECWALCCGGLSQVSYISTHGLADPLPPTTGWRPFAGGAAPAPTVERLDPPEPRRVWEPPVSVEGPAPAAAAAAERLISHMAPHLPPLIQQRLAGASQSERAALLQQLVAVKIAVAARDGSAPSDDPSGDADAAPALAVVIHGTRVELSTDEAAWPVQQLHALLTSRPLWRGAEAGEDDAGVGHGVLQRNIAAVATTFASKSHTNAPVSLEVDYRGARHTVHALPSLTGLMLKSRVIASLGLDGGFQDYYLLLGGTPFGSRTPIDVHPLWSETVGCGGVLHLEDLGDRPKAVGMT